MREWQCTRMVRRPLNGENQRNPRNFRRPHPIFGEINTDVDTGWGCGEFLKQTPQQYT